MIRKYVVIYHIEDQLNPDQPPLSDQAIRQLLKQSLETAWDSRYQSYRQDIPVGGPNDTVVGYEVGHAE